MGKNITASIVLYNSDKQEFEKVILAVVESCVECIYVVDNSPTNQAKHGVCDLSDKIQYIWGHGNIGYGAAHNIAIEKSIERNSEFHIVINPDIYFESGVIEKISAYMQLNPQIGLVMPKILSPDGELQYLCKLLPTPLDLIFRRFSPINLNYKFEMRDSGYNNVMEVPFLSGCFMFLRVEALKKVRGFDDNFFMYCEDLDLCRRISMANFKTMYYPVVEVVHVHKKESYKNLRMLKTHIKSAIYYFNKWGWLFDVYRKRINKKVRRQY